MERERVRAWVESRRAASAREQLEERRHPLPVDLAIRGALALISLEARLHGWPRDEDDRSAVEDARVRASWVLVRRRLAARRS